MIGAYQLDVLVPEAWSPEFVGLMWGAITETATYPEQIRLLVRIADDDPDADAYPYRHVDRVWYVRGPRVNVHRSWDSLARVAVTAGATHLVLWRAQRVPGGQGWDEDLVSIADAARPGGWTPVTQGVWVKVTP